ncbi:hypothetical protein LZC95_18320 [Pendulispora brunnea]|uniref:Uncharacterized protein n=1 Tax=Pendulispora brunnea TaxID=2905690 RepID=A0ABZ2KJB8_9BACT
MSIFFRNGTKATAYRGGGEPRPHGRAAPRVLFGYCNPLCVASVKAAPLRAPTSSDERVLHVREANGPLDRASRRSGIAS